MAAATAPLRVVTVTGPVDPAQAGPTDAHNHLWIGRVPGALPGAPELEDEAAIAAGLCAYRQAGGRTIVDCQPGGCGRDGQALRRLAQAADVHVLACTGYHLRRYYPPEHPLFAATAEGAGELFAGELLAGLSETAGAAPAIRAGFIKIAGEENLEASPLHLIEGAAAAATATGAALAVHTERGADAEWILEALVGFGLPPERLILYHMDKRPDFALHETLAQAGVLLEYDTFYRPQYRPESCLWPLLERMVAAGLEASVALATDMAAAGLWARPASLPRSSPA